jgi:hypothetical protein
VPRIIENHEKTITMKRNIYLISFVCLATLLSTNTAFSQDEEEDKPARALFETMLLIDNQTTANPDKGQFALEIQHRFAEIKDISDIYGIFGSANTRIGMSYGITDRLMVGLGTTRTYKLQDLEWKYAILTQTKSGRIPVSLSYHGNMVLDARGDKFFGPEEDYKFAYRMSYLNQLIVARRFGNKVSLQMAPTFVYYNAVPEGYNNANASLYFGGRFQVLGFSSIILEYDQPLPVPNQEPYPNLALGVEIGTSTHSFRVFACNYDNIVRNPSLAFNSNNPWDGNFRFGFNISIRF